MTKNKGKVTIQSGPDNGHKVSKYSQDYKIESGAKKRKPRTSLKSKQKKLLDSLNQPKANKKRNKPKS